MKRTVASIMFVFVAVLVVTSGGRAQSSGWRDSAIAASQGRALPALPSSVVGISGSMNGAFTSTPAACTVGFSNQCPSLECSCDTVTGTASISKVGKGPATISLTLDFGSGIKSGTEGDCFPTYLEFDITTPKDTETWGGVGSACDSLDDHSSPLVGGFGLQTSTVFTGGAIAQFTITPNFGNQTFKVSFKGKAER